MIANVQSSLRTAALFQAHDGAAVLRAVNRQVHASSHADRFATLFYGVFDSERRALWYVNAGHNPPMVLRHGGRVDWLEASGAPVGMFGDWHFQEHIVQLHHGDLIVAYTDGFTEATNPAGEEWGVEGLQNAVGQCSAQCAPDIVRTVFASMDEFTQGTQRDDATVVVLRVK